MSDALNKIADLEVVDDSDADRMREIASEALPWRPGRDDPCFGVWGPAIGNMNVRRGILNNAYAEVLRAIEEDSAASESHVEKAVAHLKQYMDLRARERAEQP